MGSNIHSFWEKVSKYFDWRNLHNVTKLTKTVKIKVSPPEVIFPYPGAVCLNKIMKHLSAVSFYFNKISGLIVRISY